MKKRALVLVCLALLVWWAVKAEQAPKAPEGVRIYFTVSPDAAAHGPSIGSERYQGPLSQDGTPPGPWGLMHALLAGPTDETLTSPFPKGLVLETWNWDQKHLGNLQLRLSEQYSGLTDISLTLADYCIVLTMSQIPNVETVEILSGGYSATYRSHPLLRPEEAVLWETIPDVKKGNTLP